jgi:hypothetical protein
MEMQPPIATVLSDWATVSGPPTNKMIVSFQQIDTLIRKRLGVREAALRAIRTENQHATAGSGCVGLIGVISVSHLGAPGRARDSPHSPTVSR